jgi:serine/threonine protein kinase
LHQNSQLLVDKLKATELLDGRFEKIELVNYNSVVDAKRGSFSLVFKAYDRLTDRFVALKFYDPDPQWMNDQYRFGCFQREYTVLNELRGADRCLQLASELGRFILEEKVPGGLTISLACHYFAVDWLDQEIDGFFLQQELFPALAKLHLFNEIVLAVEALHVRKIYHRDLKWDNLRATQAGTKRVVVAIDLGTAIRLDAGNIQRAYLQTVGAPPYAAPEAWFGLAGSRSLAPYTDMYALGCLLYELFNHDFFFEAVRTQNGYYDLTVTAMGSYLQGLTQEDKQIAAWRKATRELGRGIVAVPVNGPGSSVPAGIACFLNEVVASLTHIDFEKRPAILSGVRQKIWAAIRLLQNQHEYQKRLEKSRELKRRKIEKVRQQEARLALRLEQRKKSC